MYCLLFPIIAFRCSTNSWPGAATSPSGSAPTVRHPGRDRRSRLNRRNADGDERRPQRARPPLQQAKGCACGRREPAGKRGGQGQPEGAGSARRAGQPEVRARTTDGIAVVVQTAVPAATQTASAVSRWRTWARGVVRRRFREPSFVLAWRINATHIALRTKRT